MHQYVTLAQGGENALWRFAVGEGRAGGGNERGVLQRRPVRLVTVALANKIARIAWALMTRKEVYQAQGRIVAAAKAAA